VVRLWNCDLCNQTTDLCFGASKLDWKQATKQWGMASLSGAENSFMGYQTTGCFWPMACLKHAGLFFSLAQS
jgi:hypothetical protein